MIPTCPCLSCGYVCDAATLMNRESERAPEPGDISICLKCGHIMAFDDRLMLRQLTDQEMHEVAGDPDILALQRARGRLPLD